MNIGINAQILNDAATGVARYAENMIRALLSLESRHSFVLFGGASFAGPGIRVVPTSSTIDTSARRILWEQLVLPGKARAEGVDLLYYPDHTGPLLVKHCQIVITIHDLAFLSMPETHQPARRMYKSMTFHRSVVQSDKIVADSDSTQRECVNQAGIPKEKIVVVHGGVDPSMHRENDAEILSGVKTKYGLKDRFILYVGTLERRKNLVRLVHSFAKLKKNGSMRHQLVLAGGRGYGYEEILEAARTDGVTEDISFPGFVEEEDMSPLYSLADLLVYPSLYEGFGFPPLEAMACGCPVIASNVTSLPEVVGDAGLLIDPSDTTALSEAILHVVSDREVHKSMVAKGYERVKKFSWQNSAQKLLGVFDSMT